MNKSEFINRLEKALGNIKWEEKKEIIYDYEEYFENAVSEGKTEQQAAEELGNPEEIALNYFKEGSCEPGNENKGSGFSDVLKNIVKSAVDFASQSINEAMHLEKIEIDTVLETEVLNAARLEVTKCRGVDVRLLQKNTRTFLAKLTGTASTDPEKLPDLKQDFNDRKNVIEISVDWKGQRSASMNGELIVEIPEEFSGEVYVETVSGDLTECPEGFKGLSFKSVSGKLALKNLSVQEELYSKTVSGDLEVELLKAQKVAFKSVSGSFFSNSAQLNSVKFDSTSGDLKLSLSDQPELLKSKTVSGNLAICLPENSGVNLNFKSVSGRLKTGFAFTVENEKKGFGSYRFKGQCPGEKTSDVEVKSVSGNLDLQKAEGKNE